MNARAPNVDPEELARFGKLAHRWWDPDGESRPLHDLNPVRLGFVAERVSLPGAKVADIGCGGGLLSEALAKAVAGDAAAYDDAFALRAATLNGARALQLDARIGSIEIGKRADLAAVKLDEVETQPLYNVVSHLAYAVSRRQVSDVWIDGVRKLDGGALVDFDLAGVLEKARRWRERIAAL